MKFIFKTSFGLIVFLSFFETNKIAASQGREVQYMIKRTSEWQRPHTEKKVVSPKVQVTSRQTAKLIQKNRWFVRKPDDKNKENNMTSSRRYLPQTIKLDESIVYTGRKAYKVANNVGKKESSSLGFKYRNVNEQEIKTGRLAYQVTKNKIRTLKKDILKSGYAARRLAELRKNKITKELEQVSRNVLTLVETKNDISDTFRPSQ